MEYDTFYFLPAGEPKENESAQKYSTIYSNVGINNIDIVTNDRIKKRESFILLPEVINHKGNIILLIPSILDVFNALSYDGVEYAMRLYFKYAEQKKENFQIVVLGTEEESAFWNHCKYSAFLKCPHVKYAINNVFEIKEHLQLIQMQDEETWMMNWNECRESIKAMNVIPPASYKTHHSITNEWSIYRWSKYLGIKNSNIQKEIDDFLYFNYLKAMHSESNVVSEPESHIKEKGRILLIDDESGKGWSEFFKALCGGSDFKAIGDGFKKMTPDEIVAQSEQIITTFIPDVILLDLRLHDDDFDVKEPSLLTGYAVYKKIKEINKGIQIILFSASNKIWNYEHISYNGIVLKESPEQSVRENYTQECIENLCHSIDDGIRRGKYLINIYKKVKKIKDLLVQTSHFKRTEEVVNGIDMAFDILAKSGDQKEYRAYSYLQFFLTIEEFVRFDTSEEVEASVFYQTDDKRLYLYNGENRYLVMKKSKNSQSFDTAISFNSGHYTLGNGRYDKRVIDTNFLVSSLLIFKFGQPTSGSHNWTKVLNVRNTKAAHPKIKDVSINEMEMLIDFMLFFFDETNVKWLDTNQALDDISSKDEIDLLKERFGSR